MGRRLRSAQRSAFTLVEALVVIVVAGSLLAILLPVLASSRERAARAAALARQRDVGTSLRAWSVARQEWFPYWGLRGTHDAEPVLIGGVLWPMSYWNQPTSWAFRLVSEGFDEFRPAGLLPEIGHTEFDPRTKPWGAFDRLAHAAFAAPAYWRTDSNQPVSEHQPQQWTTIRHPARKGVLSRIDYLDLREDPEGDWRRYVYFADGHSERLRVEEMILPPTYLRHGREPVLHTEHGLLGRDK